MRCYPHLRVSERNLSPPVVQKEPYQVIHVWSRLPACQRLELCDVCHDHALIISSQARAIGDQLNALGIAQVDSAGEEVLHRVGYVRANVDNCPAVCHFSQTGNDRSGVHNVCDISAGGDVPMMELWLLQATLDEGYLSSEFMQGQGLNTARS